MASSNKLFSTFSTDIAEHEVAIFDFSGTVRIDDSAAVVVGQLVDVAIEDNIECIVMGLRGLPGSSLRALGVLHRIPEDRFVENLDEVKVIARCLLG